MIATIRNFLQPRLDIFYDLLIEQAAYAVEATNKVLEYLNNPGKKRKKQTRKIEKEADDVRRKLVTELGRTFVTPFDREDIHALSRNLDDVVDYAYTTTEELLLFELPANESMLQLATLVQEGAQELYEATCHLKADRELANVHAQRAKKAETRVEKLYRKALADLFTPPDDMAGVMEILKQREVYRHISNTADRVDEAADILSDLVVKMS